MKAFRNAMTLPFEIALFGVFVCAVAIDLIGCCIGAVISVIEVKK